MNAIRAIVVLLGHLVAQLFFTYSVTAQDIRSLEAVLRSRVCPGSAVATLFNEIDPREYGCRTRCVDPSRNGGDCGGPGQQTGWEPQCAAEVRKKNETIRAYNRFIRECHAKRRGGIELGGEVNRQPGNLDEVYDAVTRIPR